MKFDVYYYQLLTIQFLLAKCLTLPCLPQTSHNVLMDIKDKIDFEILLFKDVPF